MQNDLRKSGEFCDAAGHQARVNRLDKTFTPELQDALADTPFRGSASGNLHPRSLGTFHESQHTCHRPALSETCQEKVISRYLV